MMTGPSVQAYMPACNAEAILVLVYADARDADAYEGIWPLKLGPIEGGTDTKEMEGGEIFPYC